MMLKLDVCFFWFKFVIFSLRLGVLAFLRIKIIKKMEEERIFVGFFLVFSLVVVVVRVRVRVRVRVSPHLAAA